MRINYKQLIFAREYRGYNQTELALKIKGLSQSNLSKFEKGFDCLSDETIDSIIDFLNFPKSFFDKDVHIYNMSETAHFRRRNKITASQKNSLEKNYRLIGYLIDQMSESIEFPDYALKSIDLEDGYTPEEVANYMRRYFSLADRPVKNIMSLVESSGIIIVDLDTNIEEFDGVSFLTDKGYPVIVLNRNMSNDRKRFTVSHELGHILMHTFGNIIIPEGRDKEKEANLFASEFLMPKDVIKKSLIGLKLGDLAPLKSYWLTSIASIIMRASYLGCIDKNKATYFNIELSRKGYRKNEPINVFIDRPEYFYEAYRMHKESLSFSDKDLSEAFRLPIDVTEKLFVQPNNGMLRVKIFN